MNYLTRMARAVELGRLERTVYVRSGVMGAAVNDLGTYFGDWYPRWTWMVA